MEDGTRRALRAVASALFPSARDDEIARQPEAKYLRISANHDVVIDKVLEVIHTRLNCTARFQLLLILRLLDTRFGSLLLCQTFRAAFSNLPLDARVHILQSWCTSYNKHLRKAFKGLKGLVMSVVFTQHPDILECLEYTIPTPNKPPLQPAVEAEQSITASLVDLTSYTDGQKENAAAALAAKGLIVTTQHQPASTTTATTTTSTSTTNGNNNNSEWSSLMAKHNPDLVVEADVIIIGSGAGGGPAAYQLTSAGGLKVIVLEKSNFTPMNEMTLKEGEAYENMYEAAGTVLSENGATTVLAGSVLGGGTRINWSASFKTPPHVVKEWSSPPSKSTAAVNGGGLGLSQFASEEYSNAMEAVCKRLHVHTGFKHSTMCSTLMEGFEELDIKRAEVPRNCVLDEECSGHCCFGCKWGGKQDTVNTWLGDACKSNDNGGHGQCRIVTGVYAQELLIGKNDGSSGSDDGGSSGDVEEEKVEYARKKKVLGVMAVTTSQGSSSIAYCGTTTNTTTTTKPLRIAFKAPMVVSSAGSLHTPALFLRSGLKSNNIGSNLRLHPCTCVVGIFDHPIKGWEGPLMTTFSNEIGNWESSGYGTLLYNPAIHPGLFGAAAPWLDGPTYKELMVTKYKNVCVVLVLTRDQGSGKVVVDKEGAPRVHYTVDGRDKENMLKGVKLGLEAMAAAGASSVMALVTSPEGRFDFPSGGGGSGDGGGGDGGTSNGVSSNGGTTTGVEVADATTTPEQQQQQHHSVSTNNRANDPQFKEWVDKVVELARKDPTMPTFSAHQMGTAKLGTAAGTSVLDPNGMSWECSRLYCADGSVLPTSTGVNPMISIESVSYFLSGRWAAAAAKRKNRRQPMTVVAEK